MNFKNISAFEINNNLKSKETTVEKLINDVLGSVSDESKVFITKNKNAIDNAKNIDANLDILNESNIAGVPIGVQDNICTKGILTTCGSKMLYNFIPSYNATVVEKIEHAGGIIVGKTNMDEFGIGYTGETSYYGSVANPNNSDYVSGGSSSGTVAGVALGNFALGLGTAVREPASFCGVVGFKPTYKTVSRYGAIIGTASAEQVSPVGKSVKDVALLYGCISGQDEKDPISLKTDYKNIYNQIDNFDIKNIKIGIPKEYFSDLVCDDVKRSVNSAVEQLKENGAQIVEVSLPSTPHALSAFNIISSAESASGLYKYDGISYGYVTDSYENVDELYEKTRAEGFGEKVKQKIMLGMYVLGSDQIELMFNKAVQTRRIIEKEYKDIFEKVDILITPTMPITAPKFGDIDQDKEKSFNINMCTVAADLTGMPAITVPCGKDGNGLPIGMQIIGNNLQDKLVLSAANYYENLVGGFVCSSEN